MGSCCSSNEKPTESTEAAKTDKPSTEAKRRESATPEDSAFLSGPSGLEEPAKSSAKRDRGDNLPKNPPPTTHSNGPDTSKGVRDVRVANAPSATIVKKVTPAVITKANRPDATDESHSDTSRRPARPRIATTDVLTSDTPAIEGPVIVANHEQNLSKNLSFAPPLLPSQSRRDASRRPARREEPSSREEPPIPSTTDESTSTPPAMEGQALEADHKQSPSSIGNHPSAPPLLPSRDASRRPGPHEEPPKPTRHLNASTVNGEGASTTTTAPVTGTPAIEATKAHHNLPSSNTKTMSFPDEPTMTNSPASVTTPTGARSHHDNLYGQPKTMTGTATMPPAIGAARRDRPIGI